MSATFLSISDFAALAGCSLADIPPDIQQLIAQTDFQYELLEGEQKENTILYILKKMDANAFSRVGEARKNIWEMAWSERQQEFAQDNYNPQQLMPRFFDKDPILRLNFNYIKPRNPKFQWDFSEIFRMWLFDRYLQPYEHVFEFGCGSGFNLQSLSKRFPQKMLHGLDWSKSAVETVNQLGQQYKLNINGSLFDFFHPDSSLEIPAGSAILTMSALEQVGKDFGPFMGFLLEKHPAFCLHMEPLADLYQTDNLVDYLAYRYHKQRAYLDGFLPALQQMEAQKQIRIIAVHRVAFGDLYQDGFSFVAWEPWE